MYPAVGPPKPTGRPKRWAVPFEQRESEEVGYDRHFEPCLVAVVDKALVVLDGTVAVRPLNEGAEELCGRLEICIRAGDDLDTLTRRTRAQDR